MIILQCRKKWNKNKLLLEKIKSRDGLLVLIFTDFFNDHNGSHLKCKVTLLPLIITIAMVVENWFNINSNCYFRFESPVADPALVKVNYRCLILNSKYFKKTLWFWNSKEYNFTIGVASKVLRNVNNCQNVLQ